MGKEKRVKKIDVAVGKTRFGGLSTKGELYG